ncbi:hypothetical protein F373_gp027 [Bacillus phage SP-10]|uniref:hypothetical protein n=1 Tax=Bacillus phage SP10 TaxID=941058 RepID=UPI0002198AEF|nr:hypothetical protein F373_gp027 [Bacillus phage SP-10]BAK52839.1 hypothetical protein [Bacillus phage SP-10]
MEFKKPEGAHGRIQWKGTDVCMDVYCKCGYHGHIDEYFVYHVRCPKCKRVYACNAWVELKELSDESEATPPIIKELPDDD